MKTEREKFEAWYETLHNAEDTEWLAWQAAIASRDEEIENIKAELRKESERLNNIITQQALSWVSEVEQLKAKVAMLSDAITNSLTDLSVEGIYVGELFDAALNATEADVKKFINDIKADALEEAREEIERLEEKVAMLRRLRT